jgi:hypothetical protein
MINMIKTAFDIALYDPWTGVGMPFAIIRRLPRPDCHTDVLQCSVTIPSRPEAIRDMPKRGFKERLDDLLYGARNHTVLHGWHPEGPELPRFTRLGYPHSASGTWYIGARTKLSSQTLQECGFPLPMNALDGDPVDTRRSFALICGNRSPGTPQIAAIGNPTPQLAILPFGIFPTPLIESSLHVE